VQRLGSVLDETLGDKVRQLPGVRRVSPALAEVVSFEKLDIFRRAGRGLPLDSFILDDIRMVAGRRLQPGDKARSDARTVIAKNLDTGVGRRWDRPRQALRGGRRLRELQPLRERLDDHAAAELQQLMDRKGEVTALMVITESKDRETLDSLGDRIAALAPCVEVLRTHDYHRDGRSRSARPSRGMAHLDDRHDGRNDRHDQHHAHAVFERTRELAILRAIGWRKSRVVKLILWESMVLGLAGAVAGTILAIVITQVLSRLLPRTMVSGEISPPVIFKGS